MASRNRDGDEEPGVGGGRRRRDMVDEAFALAARQVAAMLRLIAGGHAADEVGAKVVSALA